MAYYLGGRQITIYSTRRIQKAPWYPRCRKMLRRERNPFQRIGREVGTSPTLIDRATISKLGSLTRIVPFRTLLSNYLVSRYSSVANDVGDLGAPKFRRVFLKLVRRSFWKILISRLVRSDQTCRYGAAILLLPRISSLLIMRTLLAVITGICSTWANLLLFPWVYFLRMSVYYYRSFPIRQCSRFNYVAPPFRHNPRGRSGKDPPMAP